MLPNQHNIYLHDTPAKDKFANSTRAPSAMAASGYRARKILALQTAWRKERHEP